MIKSSAYNVSSLFKVLCVSHLILVTTLQSVFIPFVCADLSLPEPKLNCNLWSSPNSRPMLSALNSAWFAIRIPYKENIVLKPYKVKRQKQRDP